MWDQTGSEGVRGYSRRHRLCLGCNLCSGRTGQAVRRSGFGDMDSERYYGDQGMTADVSERRREKPLLVRRLPPQQVTECDWRFFYPASRVTLRNKRTIRPCPFGFRLRGADKAVRVFAYFCGLSNHLKSLWLRHDKVRNEFDAHCLATHSALSAMLASSGSTAGNAWRFVFRASDDRTTA